MNINATGSLHTARECLGATSHELHELQKLLDCYEVVVKAAEKLVAHQEPTVHVMELMDALDALETAISEV